MAMQTSIRVILTFLLFLIPTKPSFSVHSCEENDRQALLDLKHSAVDPSRRLSSWAGLDCCKWRGIGCDNKTGHVLKLDLRNPLPFDWDRSVKDGGIYGSRRDITYEGAVLKFVEVNPSLVELEHLSYLDLSWNNFSGIKIPNFFGSFQELRYLNLSSAFFGGHVPHHLGNLSSLNSLDLGTGSNLYYSVYYSPLPALMVDTLHWISNLISLEHLDMSEIDLSKVPADSFGAITLIAPNLLELHFHYCRIQFSPFLSHRNLSSLVILDLGGNLFDSLIPTVIGNMTSLEVLDLSENHFYGPIPAFLGALASLKELHLSDNQLNGSVHVSLGEFPALRVLNLGDNKLDGPIPVSLGELPALEVLSLYGNKLTGSIPVSLCSLPLLRRLDLSYNKLNGSIPVSIGELPALEVLSLYRNELTGSIPISIGRLSALRILSLGSNRLTGTLPVSIGHLSDLEGVSVFSNLLEGVLSEMHFVKLSKLTFIYLANNSFNIHPKSGWVFPGDLERISISFCQVGPQFPYWLQNQTKIRYLIMSNASISDSIPNWFQHLTTQLELLDLSFNHIQGNVSILVNSNKLRTLRLKSIQFEGQLPHFPPSLTFLDLSNNNFNGMIHGALPDMQFLDLSNNHIHGDIPNSLCEMESLYYLDLSKNHLSGTLPQCWRKSQKDLLVIDFSSNKLVGTLTDSVCKLPLLKSLRLSNNMFHGGISALKNCTSLFILDLGENALSGQIPSWIGGSLSFLKILRLRSNKYNGGISPVLCRLFKLQILDLAHNNLSGTIPYCFSNFSAMVFNQSEGFDLGVNNCEKLIEVINGKEQEYLKILSLLINLDLSCNNLVGQIPQELTRLSGLIALNLSNNHLTGIIPENIGQMSSLISLDFSQNNLSGAIPQTVSLLFRLSSLNLSNNHLSGAIPLGYQLQTLSDPSIYEGNLLCGAPLKKNCGEDERPYSAIYSTNKGDEKEDQFWFYIGLASGIIVGFWGVWCVLFFKKTWRHAYFRFVDDVKEKFMLAVEVWMNQLKNMLKNDETAWYNEVALKIDEIEG